VRGPAGGTIVRRMTGLLPQDAKGTAISPPQFSRPAAPCLVAGLTSALWLTPDGEVEELDRTAAGRKARLTPPLVCHAKALARRLDCKPFPAFDLLELYAFVRPASFCIPTPRGLTRSFGLPMPETLEDEALGLLRCVDRLLSELAARPEDPDASGIAWTMAQAGWPWGPFVLSALGFAEGSGTAPRRGRGLDVWTRLPEWYDTPPAAPPGNDAVDPGAARTRLAELLDEDAEARPQQSDYASAVTQAFAPREHVDEPNLVLAEAGTGTGKTLGYIAPASLWAEQNKGPVWISTYTRNLQHQIDGELDQLHPDPEAKAEKVVIRKGRENYLCLLNYEDAVRNLAMSPWQAVAAGLMARWMTATRDGALVGSDFPGWLAGLLGPENTIGLADRRGECIYSACPHYGKCFIERSLRRARHADIVVANHALVMIQAALGGGEDGSLPSHYVFDEGHHLFDASDNAFAAHLSGFEAAELRRWLLGSERARGGRSAERLRGLRRRLEDLVSNDGKALELLDEVLKGARILPGEGWRQRLADESPRGPTEAFLALVRQQVYARTESNHPHGLETDVRPVVEDIPAAADVLSQALGRLKDPLKALKAHLAKRLDEETDDLDSDTRRRIELLCRGLDRRIHHEVESWQHMLQTLESETPPEYCEWFAIERDDGREKDVGMFRHWVDPTRPFAKVVLEPAQGAVITSATLTDRSGEAEKDWEAAETRCGTTHLDIPAMRNQFTSPFDYGEQTKVLIVKDVRKDDLRLVSAAYRELFLAAGGGALGIFTAISRLRAVHAQLAQPLEEAGIPLYAQHVYGLDTSTLVDIFRAEVDSCLLGTDAVRDGVDVPGRSLRLIVFDRVPWPRPDIRHRARRGAFGGRHYDDLLTRLKLRQAYGRLIRRANDKGVFVLLDPMTPTRLLGAFPEGVSVERVGVADAVAAVTAFLGPRNGN